MTHVYVDAGAARLPDAALHLAHLLDAGLRVVLITGAAGRDTDRRPGAGPHSGVAWSGRQTALPAAVTRGSWLVTTRPERCIDRRAGLRTLLIGPTVSDGPRPTLRCDVQARDLRTAVLEVLARDVMP